MNGKCGSARGTGRSRVLFLLPIAWTVAGWAQTPFLGPVNPLGNRPGGIHLYSVSAYTGYTSQARPQGGAGFLFNPLPLGSDQEVGGDITVGWNRRRAESQFSMTYSGSYNALLRHSEWNSSNHSVSFSSRTKASPRWSLGVSAAARVGDFANFLFTPTAFPQLAAIPATFDELAAAMLARKFTNDQLASILTGATFNPAGLAESPAGLLLYGNRAFNASLQSTASYARSPRLSIHFGVGASRSQHLYTKRTDDTLRNAYLIPQTTGAQGSAGLSYALSPRTQIGVDAVSSRSFSAYQDAYITSGTAFLGRTMGRRWFLQARGGAGTITAVRQTFTLPRGPRYLAGATLGVKASPHTFLMSYHRSIGDSYGLGAGLSETTTGAWHWSRPGEKWVLFSSVSHQRLLGSGLGQLEGSQAGAGAVRTLNRHTSMSTNYVYFKNSRPTTGFFQGLSYQGHAVRVSFAWTPGAEGLR